MENQMIIESSEFNKVIFECEQFYPEGKPVECLFRLNGSFKVEPTDFIGIFRVGFSSPREFLVQYPVHMELFSGKPELSGRIVFAVEQLPKFDGEFYQFVYVAGGKYIRGVSIPFQFRRVNVSENIVEMTSIFNKWYPTVMRQQYNNEEIPLDYFRELRNLNGEILRWKLKFDETSIENRGLFEQLQRRVQQIDSLRDELELLRLRRGELSQLKESTTGEELRRIAEELRLTNEKMVRWEREFEEKCGELSKIKIELRRNEMLVEEQTQTIKAILGERDSLLNQINILKGERIELVQSNEWMSKDLLMCKERLVQAERYRDMYKVQFELLRSELESVSFNGSKLNWSELMQKMEQEWILREKQLYGSYYSLQYANGYLTKRVNTQSIELGEQKQRIAELIHENELLQDKLRNGAYEYACLNKKYLALVNGKHEIVPTTTKTTTIVEQPRQSMTPSTSFVTLPEHPIVNKPTEHIVSSFHKSTTVEHPILRKESVECLIPSTLKPTTTTTTTTITQYPKPTVVPTPKIIPSEQHSIVSHKQPEHLESREFTTIRREQSWSNGERREFVKTPFGDYHLNF